MLGHSEAGVDAVGLEEGPRNPSVAGWCALAQVDDQLCRGGLKAQVQPFNASRQKGMAVGRSEAWGR